MLRLCIKRLCISLVPEHVEKAILKLNGITLENKENTIEDDCYEKMCYTIFNKKSNPIWCVDVLIYQCKPLQVVSAIFFHQTIVLQKLWKILHISSNKLFSFWRYSIFCIFSPFLFTLYRFKRTNESRTIYVMNWLGLISRCNFCNKSKSPLYYIIKLVQLIHR